MTMLDALIMDAAMAQTFRDATAGRDHQLNPRLIEVGPFAGHHFLPARLAGDAHFADIDFGLCTAVSLDPALAWPAVEEAAE